MRKNQLQLNPKVKGKARDIDGNEIAISARLTYYVLFNGIIAGACGLTLGLDNGLTGGVEDMDAFLKQFYPNIANAKESKIHLSDPYCIFDNQLLGLFTSIAYIGGIFGGPFASYFTKYKGRKWSVIMCGWIFMLGAALQCSAFNIPQLFIGRFLLGFSVGIGISCGPMFLNEVAPPQMRGAFNMINEWCITGGILLAQLINIGTVKYTTYGYRVSLGVQGIPALLLAIGGFFILESPNSLIERGHLELGKSNLQKLRGVQDVELEYGDMYRASERGKSVKNPWRALFQKENLPQTIICWLLPCFQQFTGINVIMFYSPQVLTTLGLDQQRALHLTLVLGIINFLSTAVSVVFVDRLGRKALYLEGGIQMMISQIVYGIVMGIYFKPGFNSAKIQGILIFLNCIFVAGYSWSWGALPFLTPAEFLKLELRPSGLAFNTISNFLFTFIVGQTFLKMFCTMKYGVYFFFAGMEFIMTLFIMFFTPESKGIPLEEVHEKFKKHWFWKICHTDRLDQGGYSNGTEMFKKHGSNTQPRSNNNNNNGNGYSDDSSKGYQNQNGLSSQNGNTKRTRDSNDLSNPHQALISGESGNIETSDGRSIFTNKDHKTNSSNIDSYNNNNNSNSNGNGNNGRDGRANGKQTGYQKF